MDPSDALRGTSGERQFRTPPPTATRRGTTVDIASAADTGSDTWFAAGIHEDALLTSDGRPVLRDSWCRCKDTAAESWAADEAWTGEGRVAHGFACSTCRMITQTG